MRWHERNTKWEARIFDGQKQVSLGYFDTENAAALAYDAKAIRLRGANAQLNFPLSPAASPSAPRVLGVDADAGDGARRRPRSQSFTPGAGRGPLLPSLCAMR